MPAEITLEEVPPLDGTLWQWGNAESGSASYCRFFDDGYMMYIHELPFPDGSAISAYNIGFPWKCEGFNVTFNFSGNTFQGYFVNKDFINAKNKNNPLVRVTDKAVLEKYGESFHFSPMSVLPGRGKFIQGSGSKVEIFNSNDYFVAAAIVTPESAGYLLLPPGRGETIDVPDGNYDVYFVYSTEPESLYQGDSFSVRQQKMTITIQLIEDGNYGVKKVR
ncbi:MAG: hypothetical protein LBI86_06710 [Treponema sp.]|nr:hypothetical protein [Treponema sp.]